MTTLDEAVREAVERAFAVEQLQEHPGWPVFVASVEEALVAKKRLVLSGNAGEQYAAICGFIAGAEFALETQQRLEGQAVTLREKTKE